MLDYVPQAANSRDGEIDPTSLSQTFVSHPAEIEIELCGV
jgi:hypothetical protein